MEEIYICCGLGDCLLYCQIYDLYRDTFKYQYVLNENFVALWKNDSIYYCNFVKTIFNFFNVPLKIICIEHLNNQVEPSRILLKYPLKQLSLSNYIPYININLPDEYIVVNLNIRIVDIIIVNKNSIMSMIDKLVYILNNYQFKIPIIIIGHRETYEKNLVTNYSFYNKLLVNKFIDKSYNGNLLDKPNIENLFYDINILKHAKETFQFGFGGSLCLNIFFSNKLSCILNPENDIIDEYFTTEFFDLNKNIKIYKNRMDLFERLKTYMHNNIFYLFGHKTLTEFELPILIENNFGIFLSKNLASLDKSQSIYTNIYRYDYTLKNINKNDLDKLNNIDWFSNKCVSNEIMNILNNNFKFIFITLLTSGNLLDQLVSEYKGTICYRFFGLQGNYSYKPLIDKYISSNIKYIFSYPEIYNYEITLKDNFFNSNNSHVIPLGIPDYILKYQKTYNPSNNKICFVCSKINNCSYYTKIYNNFINDIGNKYQYTLLGKNNEKLQDPNKMNNLNDDDYYKTISKCKLLYYHSKEKRHLHYHPLEAIIIGIPIIFYEESLLNSYLSNSPGKCKNINEVYLKIDSVMNNNFDLINKIICEQNKIIERIKIENNKNIFNCILNYNNNDDKLVVVLNNNNDTDYEKQIFASYEKLINVLNENNYQYIIDKKNMLNYTAIGIGDLLFRIINIQENLINKPIYINLNLFMNGIINTAVLFHAPFNNFIFKINLLNDIINNNKFITKNDFIFVITSENCNINKMKGDLKYKLIKNFNLLTDNAFYNNNTLNERIQNFIKDPFIIFHTKLRLNKNYDCNKIKEHLDIFFSGFKIKKFNIILLGEQKFKSNLESSVHDITTIYSELLKLYNYNSDKILDLTKEYIYNELNYDEYKNDICLIHKAKYNICYGQGGQLCSALLFGKCIFYNPIDEEHFFQNMNLYNSGHRYFKKLHMINKYLLEIL